jgi:hypothetical protein
VDNFSCCGIVVYSSFSSRGVVYLRTRSYALDVSYGAIHEVLKDYVRTKARPERSMAEGYVMEETLGFCIEYMSRFSATRRRIWDDHEEPGLFDEELEGGGIKRPMSQNLRAWAHSFVVDNVGHISGLRRLCS